MFAPSLFLLSLFGLLSFASAAFADGPPRRNQHSFIVAGIVKGGAPHRAILPRQLIVGTNDDDDLVGTDAADTIRGLAGADELYGREGDDFLNGGPDDDGLDGEEGVDALFGGDADDQLNSRDEEGPDHLDGGPGPDLAIIERDSSDLSYNLSIAHPETKQTLADGTTVINIEHLDFTGGSENDVVVGGALEDDLKGRDGNDTLYGMGGKDDLDAGAGQNVLAGGPGNDKLASTSDEAFGDRLNGGGGIDLAVLRRRNLQDPIVIDLSDPSQLTTLPDGTELVGIERLDFRGGGGNDIITGGALPDEIEGGDGADRLDGGPGPDGMDGGLGDDLFFVDDANDKVEEDVDQGFDTIRSSVSYTLPLNVERLILRGQRNLNATGNQQQNTLIGNIGRNRFIGAQSADAIDLGEDLSQDIVIFRAPQDSGNTLTTADTIANFKPSAGPGDTTSDLLDFHLIDADSGKPGDQAFRFVGTFSSPTPAQAAGQLRVVTGGGETQVQIDFNGDNVGDSLVRLIGTTSMTVRDFVL